jgi:hypothetical protein
LNDVAFGGFERARFAADSVAKAAAAIGTVYAGILALVFATDGEALPLRAVIAPVFLGLALVLSAAYLAFFGPVYQTTAWAAPDAPTFAERTKQRNDYLIQRVQKVVIRRSGVLRASVVALGVGLVAIALPFVSDFSPAALATDESAEVAWPIPNEDLPDALAVAEYNAKAAYAVEQAKEEAKQSNPTFIDGPAFAGLTVAIGLGLVILIPAGTALFTRARRGAKPVPDNTLDNSPS